MTVNNVAPTVEAGANQAANEGDPIFLDPATFTDPGVLDTHTANIDWGDGTASAGTVTQGSGTGDVNGSHVYADNGPYTVRVTVTDDKGASSSDTFTATVSNVAPTVDAGPDQNADVGETLIVNATFTDPGSGDTHPSQWWRGEYHQSCPEL